MDADTGDGEKHARIAGLSMGFMSSLVNIGSLTLQTAINKLGQDIIVAHTAARKISEIFMIDVQQSSDRRWRPTADRIWARAGVDRVKKGIRLGYFLHLHLVYAFRGCCELHDWSDGWYIL